MVPGPHPSQSLSKTHRSRESGAGAEDKLGSRAIRNFPESLWTLLLSSSLLWQLSWDCFMGSSGWLKAHSRCHTSGLGSQEATGYRQVPPQGPSQRCHLPRPQMGQENRNLCHLTLLYWNPGTSTSQLVVGKPLKGKGARFPQMHNREANPSSPGAYEN